ncbi:MAG: TIGR04211 family SH3 domain-containing protein [Gammaproteobacteria bacterium]|nr:TIGR04211 family SH3 domain-containing protein [Gammaproteobacteria bacterium]
MNSPLKKALMGTLFGTTVLLFSGTALAETAYVIDTLRVGVRPAPNNQAAPIGVVKTGMRLTVLETSNDFVRVKTDDELEGWIRKNYVVNTPPAMIKLQTLQQRHGTLESQLKTLEENNQVLQEANRVLNTRIDQLSTERSQWQLAQARATLGSSEVSWYWWLLGILILAGAGFYSGISWYRQLIMKRLGGLRV